MDVFPIMRRFPVKLHEPLQCSDEYETTKTKWPQFLSVVKVTSLKQKTANLYLHFSTHRRYCSHVHLSQQPIM